MVNTNIVSESELNSNSNYLLNFKKYVILENGHVQKEVKNGACE